MSFNFGGSSGSKSGTSTTVIAPASQQETDLQKANLEMSNFQLQQMRQGAADQTAYDASPQGQAEKQLQSAATQNLLARVNGTAPILTDAQSQQLNAMYDPYAQQAQADLRRNAEETAAMRGMTLADSPTGGEYLRQQANLGGQLAGTRANAALNLGQSQDIFNTNLKQFQDQLRQQAYQNRLQFSQATPASYGMQNMLLAQRMPNATQSTQGNFSGSGWGAGASAGYGSQGFTLGGGSR